MSTPTNIPAHSGTITEPELPGIAKEEQRRRRIAALRAAEGLWKDRTDIPKDGVEYQNLIRAE